MKLGYANVDKMLNEMSLAQLREWQVYADLEPFDEVRADLRAAQIVAQIANLFRKRTTAYTADELRIRFGDDVRPKPKATWQDMKEIGRQMALSSSKQVERIKGRDLKEVA